MDTKQNTLAGHILQLITGKIPSQEHIECLDCSLILYAEHEFNASTFTVRTIASTLADFYSCLCGGIGALSGPLHGGANEKSWELVSRFKKPDEAEKGVKDMIKNKELVMGFGHRVYTTSDPRAVIMKKWVEKLSLNHPDKFVFEVAERIAEVMWNEKQLFPNVDYYCGVAYHYLGIPIHYFTPLFVAARTSGWCAHLMEQRSHNKLIRPLSQYIGPQRKVWPTPS